MLCLLQFVIFYCNMFNFTSCVHSNINNIFERYHQQLSTFRDLNGGPATSLSHTSWNQGPETVSSLPTWSEDAMLPVLMSLVTWSLIT